MNDNGYYNSIFKSKTDIITSGRSSAQWKVTYYGILNYDRVFTASDVTSLNSRPLASADFKTGMTTAVGGTKYVWGADIGFKGCDGYWPPGPVCPNATLTVASFPLVPAQETSSTGCYLSSTATGWWVNGAAMYSAGDATSYNSLAVWYNNAPEFEPYDMDLCNGHAANGEYHHHHYPKCLGVVLNDTGSSHSTIWGWGNDGLPVYGPYQSKSTLAVSCWQKRDYSSTTTGCTGGLRTCLLVDQYNYTLGTTALNSTYYGPSPSSTVTSQSGNTIYVTSGAYFQDMYYNWTCAAQGGAYLDSHNGHSHGTYGYHYHLTIDSTGTATFPYTFGPKFYGCRANSNCCTSQSITSCSGTSSCSTTKLGKALTSQLCGSYVTPTSNPTATPTRKPSATPTNSPAVTPSSKPSVTPTVNPTTMPIVSTTVTPAVSPSLTPSVNPSSTPTVNPSSPPNFNPTVTPSVTPSVTPIVTPTAGNKRI